MKRNLMLIAVVIISLVLPITSNAQENTKNTKTSSKTDSQPI